MAVILADRMLTAKRRTNTWDRDGRGVPIARDDPPEVVGTWPGCASELGGQENVWSLRIDPRAWPMRPGDVVTDGALTWVITEARLHTIPGYPVVDYVAATATQDPPEPTGAARP